MKCRKCESTFIRTVYDKVMDLLNRHCGGCGYSWNDPPADRREPTTADFLRDKNTGHGHVYPRPDGVRARCGGPPICGECALDLARSKKERAT